MGIILWILIGIGALSLLAYAAGFIYGFVTRRLIP
jgi:hypothetical protein